jgi:hypothetical protein
VANPILPTGMTPELKNLYSKMLLSRLVPAMEHANHPVTVDGIVWKWEGLPPNDDSEFVREVDKWRHYFEGIVVELEHV